MSTPVDGRIARMDHLLDTPLVFLLFGLPLTHTPQVAEPERRTCG